MRPDYKIEANSKDVTEAIRRRLISAEIVDNEGLQSDTFEMTLDDRDNAVELPPTGAEIKVWLGYKETGLRFMGMYIYDEVDIDGPPDTLTLKAKAAHVGNSATLKGFNAALKEHKTRSWHEKTLGEIVTAIATAAGYEPGVDPELGGELIAHIDQTNESDLNFLTRLAEQRNAVAKPSGGALLFVPRGLAKSVSGKIPETVKLHRTDLTRWSMNIADREAYQSVEAVWHDLDSAEQIPFTVGNSPPVKKLRGTFATLDEAGRAAQAELDRILRGAAKPTFTLPGNPLLAAECAAEVSGLRKELCGTWSVTKATHSFNNNGYSATIECEAPETKK
jgi:phage protein D